MLVLAFPIPDCGLAASCALPLNVLLANMARCGVCLSSPGDVDLVFLAIERRHRGARFCNHRPLQMRKKKPPEGQLIAAFAALHAVMLEATITASHRLFVRGSVRPSRIADYLISG